MRDEILAGRFDGLVIWNGFCWNFNWVMFLEDLLEVDVENFKVFNTLYGEWQWRSAKSQF